MDKKKIEHKRQTPLLQMQERFFWFLAIIVICIVSIIIYFNTFGASFHFDDYDNIVNAVAIRNLGNIKGIYKLSERPLLNYTFALNYYFSKLNVFGYHLVNLIIHILCGILVFIFLKLTFNLPSLKDKYAVSSRWIAFFGSLIFVCHPVKIEAVTYITARSESLASLFYLLGFVFFIASIYKPHRAKLFQNLSIITSLLGMATKQIVVTLPAMVLLYDYLFVSNMQFEQLRKRLRFHFFMFLTIIPVFFFELTYIRVGTSGFGKPDLPSPLHYLFTEFRVFIYYLKLLFLPIPTNLNFDTYFPVSKSLFKPQAFISFLVCMAILTYAFMNLKKKPIVSFFIFWYFLILLPTSSIIPLEDVMYERRLYLPSLAWIVLFLLAMRKIKYKLRLIILIIIAFALSFWAYQRNFVWKTELSLWQDALKKSPLKPRTHVNIGFLYLKLGQINKAEEHMIEAIRLDPDCANAHLNLGLIYLLKERYAEAQEKFKEVLKRRPDYAAAHSNLGIIYKRKGLLNEAEAEFKEALRLVPGFAEAHANLGLIYAQRGDYPKAITELKEACRLNPDIPEPHYNLGLIYQNLGWEEKAIEEFKQAVHLNPNYPQPHYNLGISYLRCGLKEEAERQLEVLERLHPKLAQELKNRIVEK